MIIYYYHPYTSVLYHTNILKERKVMVDIKKTESFIEHDLIVDGVNIGTVELCPERKEISRLIIFEPYQNKGYGTEIVKNLVKMGIQIYG